MNRAQTSQQQIDATLRRIGGAAPPAELQSRVLATIGTHMTCGRIDDKSGWHFFHVPRLAFAAATAVLASVVIVAGSVEHSRRITLPAAGLQFAPAGGGLGTASAAHLAAQPLQAANHGRTRSRRRENRGRASVTRHVRKPAGVVVPDAPATPR